MLICEACRNMNNVTKCVIGIKTLDKKQKFWNQYLKLFRVNLT